MRRLLRFMTGGERMSVQNKALAARFYGEVFGQGKLEVADELLSADFIWHAPALPQGVARGPAGIKLFARHLREAFPDLRLKTEESIAEGDRVAQRWSFRGTQRGEFGGVAATGRQVMTSGVNLFRFAGDKIVELWGEVDQLGMLQQVGAMPVMQPEAAAPRAGRAVHH
jgi:steroid delta-isomerase-like uncharacterized protein